MKNTIVILGTILAVASLNIGIGGEPMPTGSEDSSAVADDVSQLSQLTTDASIGNVLGGFGPWKKAGCIGCVSLALGAGAATLAGLWGLGLVMPELLGACAFLCTIAYA